MKKMNSQSMHSLLRLQLLHQSFVVSFSFFEKIMKSSSADRFNSIQSMLDKSVQTFSNADLNVLQEFSILYIQSSSSERICFKDIQQYLSKIKRLIPIFTEVRLLKRDNSYVEVFSVDCQKVFNVQQPDLSEENPIERAYLLKDYIPYAVNLETFQTASLYEKVPSQFDAARCRGLHGYLAPYFFKDFL